MEMRRRVRLPLQVGVSSLWNLTGAAATLLPALALGVVGVVFYLADERTQHAYPIWIEGAAFVSVSVLVLLPYALGRAISALRARPSDVLLSPEGLRIEGGPLDGQTLDWGLIDARASSIEVEHSRGRALLRIAVNVPSFMAYVLFGTCLAVPLWLLDRGVLRGRLKAGVDRVFSRSTRPWRHEVWRLSVALEGGGRVALAAAERPLERDSLQALLDSIRALAGAETSAVAEDNPSSRDLEILGCPACGAAAPPRDADSVECACCGAPVDVPDELRERIRALPAAAGRSRIVAMVEHLLDQPGARRISARMLAGAVAMFLAWPVAFAVAAWLQAGRSLVLENAMLLAAFAIAAILGLHLALRAGLTDRQALRLVTLDLGARPPPRPDAPPECHACGAPLVVVPDQLVARCVYCGTDNVLGIDARREARPLGAARVSLETALEKRTRQRWLWRSLALAAAPLIVGAGWALGAATQDLVDPLQLLRNECSGGDMARCQQLGFHYDVGLEVPANADKAVELYRLACNGGYALSCGALAHKLAKGWGVPRDPAAAARALDKGCELGRSDLCEELGRAYAHGDGVPRDRARALSLLHKACASFDAAACKAEKALRGP